MQFAKCYACQQQLSLDKFYKDHTRKNGHATKCKACANANTKRLKELAYSEGRCRNCGKHPAEGARLCLRCLRTSYKAKCASSRGHEFTLTDEEFSTLVHSNCFYCSTPASPRNGLDRVDNSIGYTISNVVSCCYSCNRAKNSMSLTEFKAWITKIYTNWIKA